MKNWLNTIKTAALVAVIVTAGSVADAAPKKAKGKAVEAAPAVEEAADETMSAKLVVDAPAPSADAQAQSAAPGDASAQGMNADAALAAIGDGATTAAAAPAESAAAPKIDTSKLPENEIPVLASVKEQKKASSDSLSRIMITLGVLAALFAGLSYALKRWASKRGGQTKQNTRIKILTQHVLGPKKSLAIVQVAGEAILIGVTDQNISMLKTLSLIDDEIPETVPNNFSGAMEDFDEESEDGGGNFAVRGLSEIRDTVSGRIKGRN